LNSKSNENWKEMKNKMNQEMEIKWQKWNKILIREFPKFLTIKFTFLIYFEEVIRNIQLLIKPFVWKKNKKQKTIQKFRITLKNWKYMCKKLNKHTIW